MNTPFRYYPVTPAQRKWGLYVTCVGHNTTPPGATFPSPEHPDEYYFTWKVGRILHEWQIILLEKGEGVVEFKGKRHNVGAGSLIVLPPGCWHRYRPDPKVGWTSYWIGFGELDPTVVENFLEMPYALATEIWRKTIAIYLETDDESRIAEVENKVRVVSYLRLMRHRIRSGGMETEKGKQDVAYYRAQLETLLKHTDTLTF